MGAILRYCATPFEVFNPLDSNCLSVESMRAVNRAFVLSVVRATEPRTVQDNLVNAVFSHGCYC